MGLLGLEDNSYIHRTGVTCSDYHSVHALPYNKLGYWLLLKAKAVRDR